jgi:leucyl aminopeptidase
MRHDDDQPDVWIVLKDVNAEACPPPVKKILRHLLKAGEASVVTGPAMLESGVRVILVDPSEESLSASAAHRRALMQAGKRTRDLSLRQVAFILGDAAEEYLQAWIEGFSVGWFQVAKDMKTAPEILVDSGPWAEKAMREGELASQATCWARYWTEQPANILTPGAIATIAQAAGEAVGMRVEILTPDELQNQGFGGIVAVGSASVNTPRLVTLRHRESETPAIALVGKGITFDSGGVSLKPSKNLRKQKGDKAGAMAVLAGALAAAQAESDIPFMAVLPLAENLVDEKAYRPGDVITMYDGTKVEVISTDAEGRMVLADAIAFARRQGCVRIFSLATLTLSAIYALGYFRAALYCDDEALRGALQNAGDQAGEFLWPMPLDADYKRLLMQSTVADLANASDFPGGGSIVAAKFLQHFAQDTTFVHVDMSPSFYLDSGMPWADKGYLGTGGRLIYYLLTQTLSEAMHTPT